MFIKSTYLQTFVKLLSSNFISAKKLKLDLADVKGEDDKECYYIVNLDILQSIVDLIGKCPCCDRKNIELSNDKNKMKGLANALNLCDSREWSCNLYTSKVVNTSKRGGKEERPCIDEIILFDNKYTTTIECNCL